MKRIFTIVWVWLALWLLKSMDRAGLVINPLDKQELAEAVQMFEEKKSK